MIRKVFCALVVAAATVGIAAAEEFGAIITKIEDGKVTYTKVSFKNKKLEKGDSATMPVAKDLKVIYSKFNAETKKMEDGGDIKGGLSNKMFTNIGEKGRFARITTSDGKITKISIRQGKKGGKKGGKKKPDA